MADQNKTDAGEKFYSEILSPCELFAARSRTHKLPVRGQKDFFPSDSEEQRRRLEQSLDEHWSLVSEERVERLGNLVKGIWVPGEQIVELQSPAGKFWQTMGFSANGKQHLLPEEALHLMECGNLQVFHQDLPLSIQDGYEMFLSPDTLTLQQYQVFGHLKRLGYVVLRFDPSSEPSAYERQLNLPRTRDRAGRQLKRKRSASPAPACSRAETEEESTAEMLEEGREESRLTTPEGPGGSGGPGGRAASADEGSGRAWWATSDPAWGSEKPPPHSSSSPRWDFSSILFPDLGPGAGAGGSRCMAPPPPSLLPAGLSVGVCDVAAWMEKINLRKLKTSGREREREEQRDRKLWNNNREVRRCRTWAEYEELLARRQARQRGRPVHLWNREVKPLHDPTEPVHTAELLEKISVVTSTHLLEGASRLKGWDEWRIRFNVYQPDSAADFKKSSPGRASCRMCVCSFDGPVPDLGVIKLLAAQSGDVPVVFAAVDHGDVSFYSFKDFQLPLDVFP
ncbi:tRNA-splicing endonuclease subunit Sen54 [Cololabis saira]|uniref:tRNA-splicing endonuclease subunit Sen54 n=1 Tax=Cololabis saira TaxID=129043 RepID=UPI002AD208DF|nr:tRNA-splicing endonuclease subunit Sen54 [Cololabis saira]